MKQADFTHVKLCGKCLGTGDVMGAVMRVICLDCDSLGFLTPLGASVVQSPRAVSILVKELQDTRKRLAVALDNLNSKPLLTGPESGYYGNNGRGAGGSNFTGD